MKMQTKTRIHRSHWVGMGMLIAFAVVILAVSGTGCSQVEGSQCNIALSHNECSGDDIVCQIPAGCCNAAALTNGEVEQMFNTPSCSLTPPGYPSLAAALVAIGRTSDSYCCGPNSTEPQCQPCVFASEDGGAEGGADASSTTEAAPEGASEAAPEAAPDGASEAVDAAAD